MNRKILIATPVKAGLDSNYMAGLVPTLIRRFPGVELVHAILAGTAVSFARNELVHYARKIKCHEIFFIDSDMGWTVAMFEQLIAREDYDIIAALYCKRQPGAPAWLLNVKAGCEIDPKTGVCEVEDIATGFMKIKLDTVFPKLEAAYPYLEFDITQKGTPPATCWEFFRLGVEGPRTPEARLNRIKTLLQQEISADALVTKITEACYDTQPVSTLRGEDYFFCKMAREVGLKVYADFGMPIIPHIGDCAYPIMPEMVGIDAQGHLKVKETK